MKKNFITRQVPILSLYFLLGLSGVTLVIACFTPKEMRTESIPVVSDFDLNRYLGTWYEIARLPNSFEKNLEQVTATYTLRDDGKIEVLNRGFDTKKNKWKEAKGKAWVPDSNIPAKLRVSFFWIFASDYKVIALDPIDYAYALVTSSSKKYLWILGRNPQMEETIFNDLVEKARQQGFDVEKLERIRQL